MIHLHLIEGENQQWRRVNIVAAPSNTDTAVDSHPGLRAAEPQRRKCPDVESQSKAAGAHLGRWSRHAPCRTTAQYRRQTET